MRPIAGRDIIGAMEVHQQEQRSRPGWIEFGLGSLVVVGVALALVRVSLLDDGAVMAPALAAVLLLGVLGVRAIVPAGRARSILTVVAGGMLLVALLFLIAFGLLWIAINDRGY